MTDYEIEKWLEPYALAACNVHRTRNLGFAALDTLPLNDNSRVFYEQAAAVLKVDEGYKAAAKAFVDRFWGRA